MEFEKLKEDLIAKLREGTAFEKTEDEWQIMPKTKEFSELENLFCLEYEKKAKKLFENLFRVSIDIKEVAMAQAIRKSKIKSIYNFINDFSSDEGFTEDVDLEIDIDFKNKTVSINSYTPNCNQLFIYNIDSSFSDEIDEFKEIFYVPASVVFTLVDNKLKVFLHETLTRREDFEIGGFFSNVIEENIEKIIYKLFKAECDFVSERCLLFTIAL